MKRSYPAGSPKSTYSSAKRQNVSKRKYSKAVAKSSGQRKPVRVDMKGVDTALSLTDIPDTTNTSTFMYTLNLIQAGTGSWNRIGKRIKMKSLRIRGYASFLTQPTFATGDAVVSGFRMVVVYDKQSSGAAVPTFDTIFGTTNQSGTEATTYVTDPPKYDNMERFTVLRDCLIQAPTMPIVSFGTGPNTTVYSFVDEYIKLKGLDTVFLGQTNPMTIADISTGALYVYFRAVDNSGTNNNGFDGTARLRYYD